MSCILGGPNEKGRDDRPVNVTGPGKFSGRVPGPPVASAPGPEQTLPHQSRDLYGSCVSWLLGDRKLRVAKDQPSSEAGQGKGWGAVS